MAGVDLDNLDYSAPSRDRDNPQPLPGQGGQVGGGSLGSVPSMSRGNPQNIPSSHRSDPTAPDDGGSLGMGSAPSVPSRSRC